ncbi:MAG: hypothetical protein R2746_09945 [Acidimicrobiales bacterium]
MTVAHVGIKYRLGVCGCWTATRSRVDVVRRAWPAMAPFVWAQVVGGVVNVLERVGLARTGGLDELARFAPPQLLVAWPALVRSPRWWARWCPAGSLVG